MKWHVGNADHVEGWANAARLGSPPPPYLKRPRLPASVGYAIDVWNTLHRVVGEHFTPRDVLDHLEVEGVKGPYLRRIYKLVIETQVAFTDAVSTKRQEDQKRREQERKAQEANRSGQQGTSRFVGEDHRPPR